MTDGSSGMCVTGIVYYAKCGNFIHTSPNLYRLPFLVESNFILLSAKPQTQTYGTDLQASTFVPCALFQSLNKQSEDKQKPSAISKLYNPNTCQIVTVTRNDCMIDFFFTLVFTCTTRIHPLALAVIAYSSNRLVHRP